MPDLNDLQSAWAAKWPEALTLWSRFTRLSEPRWCFTPDDAKREGLTGSFAMIRFDDQAVVIGLHLIAEKKLEPFALEILAHEVGHHVYAPADLSDHGRMIARMRRALPTKEHLAAFISNLYTDLLINDRLQRGSNLRLAQVYETLGNNSTDKLWTFYMRVYEILWSLPKGKLAKGTIDDQLEGDAYLGSRLIRSYARDWMGGAGRFAALCLPYLLENEGQEIQQILRGWRDMEGSGQGGAPGGLTEIEDDELEGAIHPALDDELTGLEGDDIRGEKKNGTRPGGDAPGGSRGQYREPFEYGQILKALGLNLSDHEIAIRYYKERATPNLIRFPTRIKPESTEPLPEGLEAWDIGSPLEAADWLQSVIVSPRVVPGMTTVQRVWGTTEGSLPEKEPLDLDLYVDCSGSMPNPQVNVSYLTLAGAIIALSALRVGARVQATLWSGAGQFDTTGGFIADERKILGILTGYLGGATAFPIHVLRETYQNRKPGDRPVHILHISDDGITTMFGKDEKGNSGWEVSQMALTKARGGGSMVLNLWQDWQKNADLSRAHDEGWQISVVRTWEELVAFAKAFSKAKYGDDGR
ncbi:MAG: VWA domain-containing protein [Chloroflexi bacterium]|nr:VWA domain-containing protein [Chloroflexota bacterium]